MREDASFGGSILSGAKDSEARCAPLLSALHSLFEGSAVLAGIFSSVSSGGGIAFTCAYVEWKHPRG